MIKITISKRCQSWGQCVFDAPEVFDLVDSERKQWTYEVDNSLLDKVALAQSHCPNSAIQFEEV